MKPDFNPEHLRHPDNVCEPDVRNKLFVRYDPEQKAWRRLELKDQHEAIASIQLHDTVPENVKIQFETIRNLYLYAWFVYRFYPVCEHMAFCCLEYALREKFGIIVEQDSQYVKKGKKATFRPLLRYAIEKGYLKNEGFKIWQQHAQQRSLGRLGWEKMQEMNAKGLSEISYDESEAAITEDDMSWDYLSVLLESLPTRRNHYAHGSSSLHNTVLNSVRIVAEVINQLYPAEKKAP